MTLGETREQISTLESELSQLKDEKHQLFLQLKKVLNEDDNRRRLIKETRYYGLTSARKVADYHVRKVITKYFFLPKRNRAIPPSRSLWRHVIPFVADH